MFEKVKLVNYAEVSFVNLYQIRSTHSLQALSAAPASAKSFYLSVRL